VDVFVCFLVCLFACLLLFIGSGNIADSLTTLHTKLLLLGKLAGGVQQVRIESYQENVEVIRQFEFSMSN
jgi:hypothetical protein